MVEGAGSSSAPSAAALCTCNPALSRSAELSSASFVRLKGCPDRGWGSGFAGLGDVVSQTRTPFRIIKTHRGFLVGWPGIPQFQIPSVKVCRGYIESRVKA